MEMGRPVSYWVVGKGGGVGGGCGSEERGDRDAAVVTAFSLGPGWSIRPQLHPISLPLRRIFSFTSCPE